VNKTEKRYATLRDRAEAVGGGLMVAFARSPIEPGLWRISIITDAGASLQRSLDLIEGMIVERERQAGR
jgi:hypothetical protein